MHGRHVAVDHLESEVFLVLEVVIERAARDVGVQQILNTRIGVAAGQKELQPCLEEALLCFMRRGCGF